MKDMKVKVRNKNKNKDAIDNSVTSPNYVNYQYSAPSYFDAREIGRSRIHELDEIYSLKNRVQTILSRLITSEPYIGFFIKSTPIIYVDDDRFLAFTDGKRIYLGKHALDMSDNDLRFTLVHEALHMIYLHTLRGKEFLESYFFRHRDKHIDPETAKYLTNVVADAVVNSISVKELNIHPSKELKPVTCREIYDTFLEYSNHSFNKQTFISECYAYSFETIAEEIFNIVSRYMMKVPQNMISDLMRDIAPTQPIKIPIRIPKGISGEQRAGQKATGSGDKMRGAEGESDQEGDEQRGGQGGESGQEKSGQEGELGGGSDQEKSEQSPATNKKGGGGRLEEKSGEKEGASGKGDKSVSTGKQMKEQKTKGGEEQGIEESEDKAGTKYVVLNEGDEKEREDEYGGEEEDEDVKRTVLDRLLKARSFAKMIGKEAGWLSRWVDELLKPKIDWRTVLRRFFNYLGRIKDVKKTWERMSKKLTSLGSGHMIYPDKKTIRRNKVIVAVDTSGSIGDEELQIFVTEIYAIAKEAYDVVVIPWDTRVYDVSIIRSPSDVKNIKLTGGGGTLILPALEYIDKHYGASLRDNIIVILSDWYIGDLHAEKVKQLLRKFNDRLIAVTTSAEPPAFIKYKLKIKKIE